MLRSAYEKRILVKKGRSKWGKKMESTRSEDERIGNVLKLW